MTLELSQSQRLNLVAILDATEVQGRREVHAICHLQEKIDLSDDERKEINYIRVKTPEGQEYATWSLNGHTNLKTYEFDEADTKRLTKAIDNYRVILVRDKHWWMPLIAQLPEEKDVSRT